MFMDWQFEQLKDAVRCKKPVNVIAHSMGNRVFMRGLKEYYSVAKQSHFLFRQIHMMAADLPNEVLEHREEGHLGISLYS
jgi:esterase/lipase superfamily enzyme